MAFKGAELALYRFPGHRQGKHELLLRLGQGLDALDEVVHDLKVYM